MSLRDAGLIAIGFLAGMVVTSSSLVMMARDVEETDKVMRALRLRFNGRVQGQG